MKLRDSKLSQYLVLKPNPSINISLLAYMSVHTLICVWVARLYRLILVNDISQGRLQEISTNFCTKEKLINFKDQDLGLCELTKRVVYPSK